MTKKNAHIILLLIGLVFITIPNVQAQYKEHVALADQYFRQGMYEKAADYYLKAFKQTRSYTHFEKYTKALIADGDTLTAIKDAIKATKKNPQTIQFAVLLGDLYWQTDQTQKANETWDEVIVQLETRHDQIIGTAYLFNAIYQPKYALKAYEIGKKHIRGFQAYYLQMADLYGITGDYDSMIDIYLELIGYNPGYIQTVQNALNRNFDFSQDDAHTQMFRQKLLQKVNQYPEEVLYSEMLIWLYLQQGNFNGAFTQVKSLDKRFKENGSRLINFARAANTNEEFDISLQAYSKVIDKGPNYPYFETAKVEMLSVEKTRLNIDPLSTTAQYDALSKRYETTLNQLGIVNYTAVLARELAEIQALNLKRPDDAIQLLRDVLDTPGIGKRETALTKIDLGDYLVMQNLVWQASLYYMQAEKAFKYDELGDEAKLRTAKIAYYKGDFAWAAAKLDILKGSTSKLISNDALYLSNLITDNTTMDTLLQPMQMYAQADLKFVQQDYEEALAILDTLMEYFPGHMLADEVLFQRSKIYMKQGKYEMAIEELTTLYNVHGFDILGDDAVFQLGEIYEIHLNNKEKAMEYYLILMTEYQDSIFVTEARRRYRKLRGDSV